MSNNLKYQLRAFAIHLSISILIACIVIAVVFFMWYPSPLAKAVGVTQIFLMMLAIDVVLGPLLTLIISKPNKKNLKFDLAVIGIVQLCALMYGVYNITITRPTYVAFDLIRFEVVQANAIPVEDKQQAKPPYNQSNFFRPQWLAVKAPKDNAELNNRTFLEVQEGVSPSMRPSLYESLSNQMDHIIAKQKPINTLYEFNDKQNVDNYLSNYPQATGYLGLKAPSVDMTVLVDAKNRQILDVVDLRPWK